MNRIQLTGRLTQSPEIRSLANGGSVCHLRVAVDGMAPGRETGYINVSTFGAPGEAAARTLTKGWLVAVDGRLEQQSWEAEGQKRSSYAVVGSVEFLAAPRGHSLEPELAPQAQAGDGEDGEDGVRALPSEPGSEAQETELAVASAGVQR